MLRLDHIAVSAVSLAEGVAALEAALGVAPTGGGQHPAMATHNRLWSLGDLYLEVIAPDPSLPAPPHPRWFDLDRFTGPPRLTNWIARAEDLSAELAAAPPGTGLPMALARGPYRWQMAVPASGVLPFDGLFPALIAWQGTAHPAAALPDYGLRLVGLEITHPRAGELAAALEAALDEPRLAILPGPVPALHATIQTPRGPCRL